MMCFHYPSRDQRSSLSGCWSHSYCVLSQPRETQIQPVRECWRWIGRQLRCTVDIPAWGWSRSHWSGETCDWDLSSVSRYPPTSEYKDITYWEFISPIFVRFKVYRPQWDLQGHGDVVHDDTLYVSSQWTAVSLHTWSGLCQLRDRDGRGQRGHPPGTVLEILTLFYGKGWDNVKCMEPLLRSDKHFNN